MSNIQLFQGEQGGGEGKTKKNNTKIRKKKVIQIFVFKKQKDIRPLMGFRTKRKQMKKKKKQKKRETALFSTQGFPIIIMGNFFFALLNKLNLLLFLVCVCGSCMCHKLSHLTTSMTRFEQPQLSLRHFCAVVFTFFIAD